MSRWNSELLLLALLLTGCGTGVAGGPADAAPSAAVPGAQGRSCAYVMQAEEVPGMRALVRPGTRGNLALWGRNAAESDSVQLSLRYDEQGRLGWVRAVESTMPPPRTAELERLIRGAVAEEGPPEWGLRMRFVAGALAGIEPSVVCKPERSSAGGLVAEPLGTHREMSELYRMLGRRFNVQIRLDEQGRVMDARLPRTSGSRLLDQYVIDLARAARYEPKLHDGIGVPSLLTIRINYRPSR